MDPIITKLIGEICGTDLEKGNLIQLARDHFIRSHSAPSKISYRLANPHLPRLFSELKTSGVTLKICSGLGLTIDAERVKPLGRLGIESQDYIHANDKAAAMVNCIADSYCQATLSAQRDKSIPYLAVLVDNFMPCGSDFFYCQFSAALANLQKTHPHLKITPLLVKDKRFEFEVTAQSVQMKRELGYTLEFYTPVLRHQKEEAEKRVQYFKEREEALTLLGAALQAG